jgi:chromosome segregation ATPase
MGKKNNVRKKIDMVEKQLKKTESINSQLVLSSDMQSMSKDNESQIKIHKVKSNINKAYLKFLVNRKNRKMLLDNKKVSKLQTEISVIENAIDGKFEEMDELEAKIRLQNFQLDEKVKEKANNSNKLKEKVNELHVRKKAYSENTKIINKEEGENNILLQKVSALNLELESQLKTKTWQNEYYEKIKVDKENIIKNCEGLKAKIDSLTGENDKTKTCVDELTKENETQLLRQSELEQKTNQCSNQLEEANTRFKHEEERKKHMESNISKEIFEIEEATKQKNIFAQKTYNLESEILTLSRKLNELIVQKNELEINLEVDGAHLTNKEHDRDSLYSDVNNEKQEVDGLIISLEKIQAESEQNEIELSSLKDNHENLLMKKEEIIFQIENDKEQNNQVLTSINAVKLDSTDLESDLELLESEIERNKLEQDQREEILKLEEEKYEKLVSKYNLNEEELKSTVHTKGTIEKQLDEIDQKITSQKQKILISSDEIDKITVEEKQLNIDLKNKQTDLCNLEEENTKAIETKKQLESLVLESEVAIESAEIQSGKDLSTLQLLNQSNHEAEELLNESTSKLEELIQQNMTLESKVESVKANVEDRRETNHEKQILLEKQKLESEDLSKTLNVLKSETVNLLARDKNIEKQINALIADKGDKLSIIKVKQNDIKDLLRKLDQQNQDLQFEKNASENKTLELKTLDEKYEILISERTLKETEVAKIKRLTSEKISKIQDLNLQIKEERTMSDDSLRVLREKQTEFSRIRGQFNSLERLTSQNEQIIKRNEVKIQEYNSQIEKLKVNISNLKDSADQKEMIIQQENTLDDKKSELSLLNKSSVGKRKSDNIKSANNQKTKRVSTLRNFEKLANELSVKYAHSVSLNPNISSKAKLELETMYKRIVRSFNNLAILNINRFTVELTHDENGLLCNVILFKGNKRSDYEKDVGGFLRINPFYGLRSWEEHEETVSFSLEVEKSFLEKSNVREVSTTAAI